MTLPYVSLTKVRDILLVWELDCFSEAGPLIQEHITEHELMAPFLVLHVFNPSGKNKTKKEGKELNPMNYSENQASFKRSEITLEVEVMKK